MKHRDVAEAGTRDTMAIVSGSAVSAVGAAFFLIMPLFLGALADEHGLADVQLGLLGSAYFVKHAEQLGIDNQRWVAMINFDMVGRMTSDRLFVNGVGSGDRWQTLLSQLADQTDIDLQMSKVPFGGSDHMHFLFSEVPSIHLFTGSHSDYHRISDTADKINTRGVTRTWPTNTGRFVPLSLDRGVLALRGEAPEPPPGAAVSD